MKDDENKPMGRQRLVSEVSKDADVMVEVVDDVLESLVNVIVEEIVNNGTFRLGNVFTIDSSSWKAYKGGLDDVPDMRRLKVRISSDLRKLYRLKQADESVVIDRTNWRQMVKDEVRAPKASDTDPGFFNPMLEEDD